LRAIQSPVIHTLAVRPDDLLRLDNQLCFSLYAATRAMTRLYEPLLSRLKLTYPQYLVMLVLWEEAPLSVKAVGERLYLDSGTLSPLLKRLERQGLVERVRSAADERVVEVRPTPAGRRLREKATDIPRELACGIGLPLSEIGRLRSDLRQLTQSLLRSSPPGEKPARRKEKP
jgi:DNA-binding MarR family transcriptional regulator